MTETERDRSSDSSLLLYRLHGCPYCERVVRRLDELDLEYSSRFVAGEHSRRDDVARETGTRSVPVLIDRERGVTMPESSRILEYLERSYGDGNGVATETQSDSDLVEFPPSDHPKEGDRAIDFTRPLVTDEYWEDVSLSDLASDAGAVLLLFYPLNWGGKSMYWWKEIQRREWGGDDLAVVGIGISQPFDHQRFIETRDLEYPLYSDPQNRVAESYDIVHDLTGMAGVEEPRPAAFLVDGDMRIEYAWVAEEWPQSPPYDEIEAAMDSS